MYVWLHRSEIGTGAFRVCSKAKGGILLQEIDEPGMTMRFEQRQTLDAVLAQLFAQPLCGGVWDSLRI